MTDGEVWAYLEARVLDPAAYDFLFEDDTDEAEE